MTQAKGKAESEPANEPGEVASAFVREMYSDLAPEPNEDTSGNKNATAVLTTWEDAALNEIVSLMSGRDASRSLVLRVALRRLIRDAEARGLLDAIAG
jgi:hypothetical protein